MNTTIFARALTPLVMGGLLFAAVPTVHAAAPQETPPKPVAAEPEPAPASEPSADEAAPPPAAEEQPPPTVSAAWPAPPAYDPQAAKLPLPSYEKSDRIEQRFVRKSQGAYIAGMSIAAVGFVLAVPVGIPVLVGGVKDDARQRTLAGAVMMGIGTVFLISGLIVAVGKGNPINRLENKRGVTALRVGPGGLTLQGRF